MTNNEECAKIFCEAIATIASKPDNLYNLQCYLSSHFNTWLEKYASSPENIAAELKQFAEMNI